MADKNSPVKKPVGNANDVTHVFTKEGTSTNFGLEEGHKIASELSGKLGLPVKWSERLNKFSFNLIALEKERVQYPSNYPWKSVTSVADKGTARDQKIENARQKAENLLSIVSEKLGADPGVRLFQKLDPYQNRNLSVDLTQLGVNFSAWLMIKSF